MVLIITFIKLVSVLGMECFFDGGTVRVGGVGVRKEAGRGGLLGGLLSPSHNPRSFAALLPLPIESRDATEDPITDNASVDE